MSNDAAWLTTGQAARRIERSPQRVRQLVDAKQLEAIGTPYGRLVSASSVDQLLRERRAKEASSGGSEPGTGD